MKILPPLDSLLRQGAVFLHRSFVFNDKIKTKFLVYFNNDLCPSPLFFLLSTTDKRRMIPTLPKARQDDVLAIPPGELEFFKDSDHTFVDLNNHRELDKETFKSGYEEGDIAYVGRLSESHVDHLLKKAKTSKILQPEVKKIILGY